MISTFLIKQKQKLYFWCCSVFPVFLPEGKEPEKLLPSRSRRVPKGGQNTFNAFLGGVHDPLWSFPAAATKSPLNTAMQYISVKSPSSSFSQCDSSVARIIWSAKTGSANLDIGLPALFLAEGQEPF